MKLRKAEGLDQARPSVKWRAGPRPRPPDLKPHVPPHAPRQAPHPRSLSPGRLPWFRRETVLVPNPPRGAPAAVFPLWPTPQLSQTLACLEDGDHGLSSVWPQILTLLNTHQTLSKRPVRSILLLPQRIFSGYEKLRSCAQGRRVFAQEPLNVVELKKIKNT